MRPARDLLTVVKKADFRPCRHVQQCKRQLPDIARDASGLSKRGHINADADGGPDRRPVAWPVPYAPKKIHAPVPGRGHVTHAELVG